MHRFRLLAVIAVAGLIGCTTTQQLRQRPSGPELQVLADASRSGAVTLLYDHPSGTTSSLQHAPQAVEALPGADANVPLGDLSQVRGYQMKRHGR